MPCCIVKLSGYKSVRTLLLEYFPVVIRTKKIYVLLKSLPALRHTRVHRSDRNIQSRRSRSSIRRKFNTRNLIFATTSLKNKRNYSKVPLPHKISSTKCRERRVLTHTHTLFPAHRVLWQLRSLLPHGVLHLPGLRVAHRQSPQAGPLPEKAGEVRRKTPTKSRHVR